MEIKFRTWNGEKMVKINKIDFDKMELKFEGMKSTRPNEIIIKLKPELMQFTGLKDKNGKDIYEGDIIKGTDFTAEVRFNHGSFTFRKNGKKVDKILGKNKYRDIIVIGNIYTQQKQAKHLQSGDRSISSGLESPLDNVETEGEKEDKTLSNLSSGDTKQRGPIRAQDDEKLQIERSASLAADNQPSVCLKELLEQIGINPRNCFLDNKNNLIIPCSEIPEKK